MAELKKKRKKILKIALIRCTFITIQFIFIAASTFIFNTSKKTLKNLTFFQLSNVFSSKIYVNSTYINFRIKEPEVLWDISQGNLAKNLQGPEFSIRDIIYLYTNDESSIDMGAGIGRSF